MSKYKSFAAIVALILVALGYGLSRGVYLGWDSDVITTPDRQVLGIQKRCRYLSFSGVSKVDAHDGYRTNVDQPDEGKCSLVAE
jgi:hypothetical protein